MNFFNARFAFMALSLSVMTAANPPSNSKECNASPNPEILSSVPEKFQLAVLVPDDKGKINLKASPRRYVTNGAISVPFGSETSYTSFWTAQISRKYDDPIVFSLENKTLEAGSYGKAWLLPYGDSSAFTTLLDAIVFESNPTFDLRDALFTATEVSDSYGRDFLRLGGPDGKLLDLFPLSPLSLNVR